MPKAKGVLFLVPYPLHVAPSQRFRVELYLPYLREAGIPFDVQPFLDEATWKVLYAGGSSLQKVKGVLTGFARRFKTLLHLKQYDYIFIHREASPLGPPLFEWIISNVLRKKMIYDFDDAIWIPDTTGENGIVSWVKAFWKIKYICRWAHTVVGGNEYLCAFANQYNKSVRLIPTCVDVVHQHHTLKQQDTERVVVGWTGSHSTMKYLDALLPTLKKVSAEYDIDIAVISNKAPGFSLPNLRFIPWKASTEISDLLQLNIGLMPLTADAWSEGKCGFKLIQYLAVGIPALASPVGVNQAIIQDGINGWLCYTEDDWYRDLSTLIRDCQLREAMGAAGRQKIADSYSIQANSTSFLSLFSS